MPKKKHSADIIKETKARIAERIRIERNEKMIDAELAYLAEHVGRELAEQEQSDVLDIVDEYTPKDESRNYT